jgi:hypothetical protein
MFFVFVIALCCADSHSFWVCARFLGLRDNLKNMLSNEITFYQNFSILRKLKLNFSSYFENYKYSSVYFYCSILIPSNI